MTAELRSTPAAAARQLLRDRARVLARRPDDGNSTDAHAEVLEFTLARERYAVETRYVREVYPFRDLTPLPCTPPFVRGVVNVRGHILAVLDLKQFFGLPEAGLTDLHCILVVRGHDVGVLADEVVGVRAIPMAGLQASLPTLTGVRGDYLRGVTADRLVLLDLARILADPGIVVHDDVEL